MIFAGQVMGNNLDRPGRLVWVSYEVKYARTENEGTSGYVRLTMYMLCTKCLSQLKSSSLVNLPWWVSASAGGFGATLKYQPLKLTMPCEFPERDSESSCQKFPKHSLRFTNIPFNLNFVVCCPIHLLLTYPRHAKQQYQSVTPPQ